ncbi:MAG: riboflavin biosynthesis protein RibF [Clostridia bacterium]|nr:riboflavin biosynthesis protein RibF [Clostridia bacterium]
MIHFDKVVPTTVPTAVALGCFDGIHLAHRKVIDEVLKCREEGLTPAMFTFADYANKGVSKRIYTQEEKLHELEALGIELVYCVPFPEVCLMSASVFVTDVLKNNMNAKKVFCGFNYKFGRGGNADVATLKYLCEKEGIEVTVIDEVTLDGVTVSSSEVRRLLDEGDIKTASKMLQKPFALFGEVVHGNALGRKMGIPTINVGTDATKLLPKFGVYGANVYIDGSDQPLRAALNIGMRPTLGGVDPTVEAFIIDEAGDFYGKHVKVELTDYIREEKKFATLQDLQYAIESDIEIIRNL